MHNTFIYFVLKYMLYIFDYICRENATPQIVYNHFFGVCERDFGGLGD